MVQTADQYLQGILAREAVNTGSLSPVRSVHVSLYPIISKWAGTYLRSVTPSGSFAKGTANHSGTDIDLFISLHNTTTASLKDIYDTLANAVTAAGYTVRRQNVSLGVRVGNYDVDLVPAKRQDTLSEDHSLYRRRANTWTKTNVQKHISLISNSGRSAEMRVIKLWRNQKSLDFPSFYLELTVIEALRGRRGGVVENVWKVFQYLRDTFASARIVDPANTGNVISDELSATEKKTIADAATRALAATNWNQIVV